MRSWPAKEGDKSIEMSRREQKKVREEKKENQEEERKNLDVIRENHGPVTLRVRGKAGVQKGGARSQISAGARRPGQRAIETLVDSEGDAEDDGRPGDIGIGRQDDPVLGGRQNVATGRVDISRVVLDWPQIGKYQRNHLERFYAFV